MRCVNCGWPNKPEATTCVKCNHPLISSNESNQQNADQADDVKSNDSSLKKTVFEQEPFLMSDQNDSEKCPSCGYPLRPGSEKCPNCGKLVNGISLDSHLNNNNVVLKKPNSPMNGTVNPYLMAVEEKQPGFILTVQKRINERQEFELLEYDGADITLNRANTESTNGSITSHVQAQVTNVDGKWYIEDKSEQHTTFVLAKRKIELCDGDTILLGDRLFEFHTKQ